MSFDSSGSGGIGLRESLQRSPDVSMGFRDLALNCATELESLVDMWVVWSVR